jgi:flagellin
LDFGYITLGFQEQADNGAGNNYAATDTGDFRMTVKGGGDVATSTTKLKDIALFTNADGVNIFDNTQELTIYGNGKSTTIYLEGDDTITDFETKLTNAIVDDLSLGATTNISSTVSNVNNNLVNFVSSAEAQAGTNESVAGTFVIQTAIPGEDGQIAFVGNENLINGLSVSMIQEGENSTMTVNVTDAVTGNKIGSDVVNDNVLHKVIQGVDVKIASDVGIDVSWDATNREIVFESNNESENFKLHLANNQTQLQIGANEGQFIDTSIPQMDSKSLGLDKILVVDQDLAEKSITLADNALNKVSGVRATIGAQINRLDYSITGLDVARENITAAESRIRDLDVASEMAEFTKQQILAQSATAMLAQANQLPQMALKLLGY